MFYALDQSGFLTIIFVLFFSIFSPAQVLKTRSILFVAGLSIGISFAVGMFSARQVPATQLEKFLTNLRVGAHRGLANDAPENTIEAFQISKKLGADSIEFDVAFTKDGVAVLMHDDTVDRTTNGTGKIADLNWNEVKHLNAAANFSGSKNYTFAGVPLLADAVSYCLDNDLKLFFDIKDFHPKLVQTIKDLYDKYPELYERAAICSFDPRISYHIKKADPLIITGHTWRPFFITYHDYERTDQRFKTWWSHTGMTWLESAYIWSLHHWLFKVTGADLVLANNKAISAEYIRAWRQKGLGVVAWTVNDKKERAYYLNVLRCPFLTDQLTDFQYELAQMQTKAS